jgi:hypothetical protein
LIGPAYVSGMMNGEGWPDYEIELQEIPLCVVAWDADGGDMVLRISYEEIEEIFSSKVIMMEGCS